ncbi:MAG: DsrE family protein [Fidelibacterota bacterium]|nr:MAG: DsrE family protein [Candidatus Neomarinimicrobiota bacterium]
MLSCLVLASHPLQASSPDVDNPARLAVLWTSGDPDVAHKVCLMYTHVAKTANWFDEILLIVWGPSQKLLASDEEVRAKVDQMKKDGIQVQVCFYCAESYGLTEQLRGLGFEVKPMGVPLTEVLKDDGWKLLTF